MSTLERAKSFHDPYCCWLPLNLLLSLLLPLQLLLQYVGDDDDDDDQRGLCDNEDGDDEDREHGDAHDDHAKIATTRDYYIANTTKIAGILTARKLTGTTECKSNTPHHVDALQRN